MHEQRVREKTAEHKLKAARAMEKALEPKERYCHILNKKVLTLNEYGDYKSRFNKGEPGTIYCENIIPCYQQNIKCRYSGISPLFPDPFLPELTPEEIQALILKGREASAAGDPGDGCLD